MPQLNPAPWLATLVFSWLVFLIVVPMKILAHIYPNGLTSQSTQNPETAPWTWPWY
uniref:ATP synthase complex subunit 8 n=1 Tax=Etheostoma okaloosae TaxID=417933 RepID=A0A343ER92_ETHOK|nr:ATPase subunit 8 [Etheostoma okaloosae]ASK85704.1 ATPase subunit 8 [Etheostoma okaloosae]